MLHFLTVALNMGNVLVDGNSGWKVRVFTRLSKHRNEKPIIYEEKKIIHIE